MRYCPGLLYPAPRTSNQPRFACSTGWRSMESGPSVILKQFPRGSGETLVFKNHWAGWSLSPTSFTIRRRQWHPTPVLLPGKSHGRRSLVGCSPWGCKESDTTEQLHFHFSLSWIGEGNGSPLQCSWLENPRDSRAWWAAVYGAIQSQTRLKLLSSSSSSCFTILL